MRIFWNQLQLMRGPGTLRAVLALALAAAPTHSFLTVPAGRACAVPAAPGGGVCFRAAPLLRAQRAGAPAVALGSVKDKTGGDAPPVPEGGKSAGETSGSANPMAVVKGQADTMGKFMEKLNEYKACTDKEQR